MSRLYIDDAKEMQVTKSDEEIQKEQETKEEFDKVVMDAIENRYKGDESEEVYALFNPVQRQLLDSYFRGFSVELYKDLNGTVELQIEQRNQKIKEKIKKLTEEMGIKKFNLEDWVYDGMTDAGKNNGHKCDLCPRPVRYAHFAANKKTHEVLRFGCNCAADFFNIDKTSLASMRTIQSKTLRDIKIIAIVMEKKWQKEYYKYMAGHTGEVLLKDGVEGLRDLTTFLVKWNGDTLVENKETGLYPIKFGDGTKTEKPLDWIKENIISCLNGDLDPNLYNKIEDRKVVKIPVKEEDKSQMNTAGYVKYALKFVEVGLPIPKSLCDRLNRIISKATRQHHPDYLKYTQDLLISYNLAKSSLLKTAFTEFITSYLSEKMKVSERDPELKYWNINGQVSFYKAVLTWETMVTKLLAIKDIKTLVNKGLISEEEMDKIMSKDAYGYNRVINYINDCITMFMSSKPVIKRPENMDEGYSKYMLEGVDKRIGIDIDGTSKIEKGRYNLDAKFNADVIPFNVSRYFRAIQMGYRNIIKDSLVNIQKLLKCVEYLETEEEIAQFLCSLVTTSKGVEHTIMSNQWYMLSNLDKDKVLRLATQEHPPREEFYKAILKKYKGNLKKFKKDCGELYVILGELVANLKDYKEANNRADLFVDYDDLVVNKEKTNREYFEDYCDLLIAKRANKKMQPYMKQRNLYDLVAFKIMSPYADMLRDIMETYSNAKQEAEEDKLYDYLNLGSLKNDLKRLLDTPDLDIFTLGVLSIIFKNKRLFERGSVGSLAYVNLCNMDSPLHTDSVVDELKKAIPNDIYSKCLSDYSGDFENLYNSLKDLFMGLKSEKITFEKHYGLLYQNGIDVLKELKKNSSFIGVEKYRTALNEKFNENGNGDFKYHHSDMDAGEFFNSIKWYNNVSAYYMLIEANLVPLIEEYKAKEEERKQDELIKGPVLEKVKRYLDEHIKYHEVNVAAERKTGRYSGYSDNGIRRAVAFNEVKYQDSTKEFERFLEVLMNCVDRNDWSKGVEEVVADYNANGLSDSRKVKKYRNALRAECYNKNLIYNHFELTYRVLKDLKEMDKMQLTKLEIVELSDILGRYYLLKHDVKNIWNILMKYGATAIDLATEHNNLPKPDQLNIEDVLVEDEGGRDKSGLTGVQKAEKLKEHPDFDTLDSLEKGISETVSQKKTCSEKQLYYINRACVKLGIIKSDDITEEKKEVQESEDIKELASKVVAHPDFKTLSDIEKGVSTTISKTGRCSDKQKKYFDSAVKKLGLNS